KPARFKLRLRNSGFLAKKELFSNFKLTNCSQRVLKLSITSPRHMVFYIQQETQNNQLTPFSLPSLSLLSQLSITHPHCTPAGGNASGRRDRQKAERPKGRLFYAGKPQRL
ncbi:MAG: hypothetical protein RR998_10205, partial [Oscillospiraceae bacterium]